MKQAVGKVVTSKRVVKKRDINRVEIRDITVACVTFHRKHAFSFLLRFFFFFFFNSIFRTAEERNATSTLKGSNLYRTKRTVIGENRSTLHNIQLIPFPSLNAIR